MQITLGTNRTLIMFTVDIWPPIHNIVVVTSPMGVHAPPALAAITIMPAKVNFNSLSWINLRMSDIITIDVVRLSNTAERKNVTQHIIHSSELTFFVLMRSVINRKPWCASTNSTIVMAPIRKNRIWAMALRCSPSSNPTKSR